jgi:putative heme transporter
VSTARRAFVTSVVVVGVVAGALALWHLRLLIFLLLLGFTLAAAMRPGVERLHEHGVPRAAGVLLHFAGLAVVIGLFLWLVIPRAITQVESAIGDAPTSSAELRDAARNSTGIKHEFLVGLQKELQKLPSGSALVHPALTITTTALEVLIGIFFALATAAYWIFERERAEGLVLSLLPRKHRRVVRETWNLIDVKLGAYVRGQLLMITFVSTVLSTAFALIGLPFWLLLGVFAGIVEIVPVIGPLVAGSLAVAVGLTIDWQHALFAAIAVWGLRLLQDYVVGPHVFGRAVGLSPLIVLVTVSAVGLLFGGVYVLLSVPLAAVLATLADVFILNRDPANQEVPRILFPAKDAES